MVTTEVAVYRPVFGASAADELVDGPSGPPRGGWTRLSFRGVLALVCGCLEGDNVKFGETDLRDERSAPGSWSQHLFSSEGER